MNAETDYTICNLDNNTYIIHGTEQNNGTQGEHCPTATTTAYSYYNSGHHLNNGLVSDTGQSAYHHQQPTINRGAIDLSNPGYHGQVTSPLIHHTALAPADYDCSSRRHEGGNPGEYTDYYTGSLLTTPGLVNGHTHGHGSENVHSNINPPSQLLPVSTDSQYYHTGSPMSAGSGGDYMPHPGGLGSPSERDGSPDQIPPVTYKWMQVKRSAPKTASK